MRRLLACLPFLWLGAARAETPPVLASDTPCFIVGIETAVRCIAVDVPLDRANPGGPTIRIGAAIVPALSPRKSEDPLILLAGGPGQAATGYGRLVATAFEHVLKTRDVVLFDQRGTGLSGRLQCNVDVAGGRVDYADLARRIGECAAQQEYDPRFFTLAEVTADLEDLRRAAGWETVNLWGGSFGTRTVQHYLRAHGDHVRSAILDAALPVARSLFATAAADGAAALERVIADCAADASCATRFPDLRATVDALFARLATAPIATTLNDPLTGAPRSDTYDAEGIAGLVRAALYTPSASAVLPYALSEAATDNFAPLAALGADAAAWSIDTMSLGVTLAVLCSEDASRFDAAQSAAASSGFVGESYYRFWASACAVWPSRTVPGVMWQPLHSDVPALVISGALDPVTPPDRGAEAAAQFTAATHLVVPAGGHTNSAFGCMPKLIAAFIAQGNGDGLDAACLAAIGRPPFVVSPLGPAL